MLFLNSIQKKKYPQSLQRQDDGCLSIKVASFGIQNEILKSYRAFRTEIRLISTCTVSTLCPSCEDDPPWVRRRPSRLTQHQLRLVALMWRAKQQVCDLLSLLRLLDGTSRRLNVGSFLMTLLIGTRHAQLICPGVISTTQWLEALTILASPTSSRELPSLSHLIGNIRPSSSHWPWALRTDWQHSNANMRTRTRYWVLQIPDLACKPTKCFKG